DKQSFQRMVRQLKEGLDLGRTGILKYSAKDEKSFPMMVHQLVDDKLVDRSQNAEYEPKE
ncbi:hypothetical protein HAX54_040572, partial [Datura stramonium]|nr:hypothetical protein [Datura stramonium]